MSYDSEDDEGLDGLDDNSLILTEGSTGREFTVDIFMMLGEDGAPVNDELEARWLLAGNPEQGYYQIDVKEQGWESYVYH